MKNPVFTGAAVAIITPMYEDGSVNFDELGRIIEDQIARGTDAVVICGTTGECSTMTDEEQLAAIKFTVDTVNHRVPVVAGAGSNDTDHGCALAAKSAACGADALLLAAFAAESLASLPGTAPRKVAELGSGCGAALLGLCLYLSSGTAEMPEHCHQADALPRQCPCTQPSEAPSAAAGGQPTGEGRGGHNAPHLHALGLEQDTALCAAATANARLLGLEDVCRFRQGDLADTHFLRDCGENAFHLVLANPPYALTGSGRPSASVRRDAALRGPASLHDGPHARQRRPGPNGVSDPLAVFCHAARRLLRHHGLFCCIFPAEDLSRLLSTLERERLGCRRILPLCPRAGEAAKRVLVLARKDAAAQCRLEAPLPLHDGQCWSRGALAFCPWLGAGHEEKR